MSVFRIEKNKNYTVMSNYHLRDEHLSLKARGLLSMILSLPEDWDYSLAGLVAISKDGLTAVRGALHELEDNGYIHRERQRDPNGRLAGSIYTVYECPQPALQTPTCENRTQETHTYEDDTELSKDITNIRKESKTEETNSAYVRTTRAREETVDELLSFVNDQIGRSLSSIERRVLVRWVEQEIDPEMIRIAVQDNLFRHDRFDLRYVQTTLDEWKERGVDNPRDAKNFILNRRVDKLSYVAAEIADENYNEKLADKIMMRSEAADLQGTRDYIIELFQNGRRGFAVGIINSTYHKEILDYLPQEIVDYYEKHKED